MMQSARSQQIEAEYHARRFRIWNRILKSLLAKVYMVFHLVTIIALESYLILQLDNENQKKIGSQKTFVTFTIMGILIRDIWLVRMLSPDSANQFCQVILFSAYAMISLMMILNADYFDGYPQIGAWVVAIEMGWSVISVGILEWYMLFCSDTTVRPTPQVNPLRTEAQINDVLVSCFATTETNGAICSICQDEENTTPQLITRCRHPFHVECLKGDKVHWHRVRLVWEGPGIGKKPCKQLVHVLQ